ncbi:hypothetical protein AB0J72_26250 [Dactylosporangium sp. NPDC049742]|uniref:hypothetical protein n=1 Tax=Dactylosporangium sp. NPDC049742 TaxID=3154737 RepID=UPI0034240049
MGYFGAFLFDGQFWTEVEADNSVQPDVEFWLHVDIHDSDIATITYHPTGPGSGVAFLGFTPRTYFEDPNASLPTDTHREAAGLATWWADRQGGVADVDRDAMTGRLLPYLAGDDIEPDEDDDEEDLDDAEVFVEVKTDRLLALLDLPPIRPLR